MYVKTIDADTITAQELIEELNCLCSDYEVTMEQLVINCREVDLEIWVPTAYEKALKIKNETLEG